MAKLVCDNGDGTPSNVVTAYAADGGGLADIAWRPHKLKEHPPDGLFLC